MLCTSKTGPTLQRPTGRRPGCPAKSRAPAPATSSLPTARCALPAGDLCLCMRVAPSIGGCQHVEAVWWLHEVIAEEGGADESRRRPSHRSVLGCHLPLVLACKLPLLASCVGCRRLQAESAASRALCRILRHMSSSRRWCACGALLRPPATWRLPSSTRAWWRSGKHTCKVRRLVHHLLHDRSERRWPSP